MDVNQLHLGHLLGRPWDISVNSQGKKPPNKRKTALPPGMLQSMCRICRSTRLVPNTAPLHLKGLRTGLYTCVRARKIQLLCYRLHRWVVSKTASKRLRYLEPLICLNGIFPMPYMWYMWVTCANLCICCIKNIYKQLNFGRTISTAFRVLQTLRLSQVCVLAWTR